MEKGTSEEFIRDVNLLPELSVFVASNQQLKDIERFYGKVSSFSILGIDLHTIMVTIMLQLPFISIYYLRLQRESIQYFWILV